MEEVASTRTAQSDVGLVLILLTVDDQTPTEERRPWLRKLFG